MATMTGWTELDDRAVAYARALAMDAVQKVGNGHPGTAMSLAPVAYNLFQRHLRHDPSDPQWLGRDRFILSCGHSSLTLYIQLFLSGYGLEMKDLESFRTWGSLTPGHPEYGHTAGVEMTTGPLGQGVATAVGMAMAARYERGLLDPDAPTGTSIFDHSIWVICSDGDLQEGVSGEASSLAGTQALGNLNIIYDDNRISIEGDTHVSFTEDVAARYRAYGWHVIEVPALANEKLVGKLIYVGQTVNPDTRTVLVRTELDNSSGRLKPSMLASMLIEAAPVPRVVVPITAVVRQDEVDHVFVEESNNYFRLIPVKLAAEQNGQRVVLEGLKPGMRIVSEGAFHLNNHRNLAEMENGG